MKQATVKEKRILTTNGRLNSPKFWRTLAHKQLRFQTSFQPTLWKLCIFITPTKAINRTQLSSRKNQPEKSEVCSPKTLGSKNCLFLITSARHEILCLTFTHWCRHCRHVQKEVTKRESTCL